jgi:hypothetical protein
VTLFNFINWPKARYPFLKKTYAILTVNNNHM